MILSTRSPSLTLRLLIAAAWSLLGILSLGAPILASRAYYGTASCIYLVFSKVCHQMPDRSFFIAGFPLAICHRCSGMYLGFILGSLFRNPFLQQSPGVRRMYILASIIPLAVDVALPFAGIGTGSPISRFLTGLFFGTMLSSLLLYGIIDLLGDSRRRLYFRGGDE